MVDLPEIMGTVPPEATTVFPEVPDWETMVDVLATCPGSEEHLVVNPESMADLVKHLEHMSGKRYGSGAGFQEVNVMGIKVVVSDHLPEGTAAMLVAGSAPENGMVIMQDFKEEILAELRYEFDGTTWAALVTLDKSGDGYCLWYQRGIRYQRSGTFSNGKALVKYIREEAKKKFEGFAPVKDTLNRIRTSGSPSSVVPKCYGDPPKLVSAGPNMWEPRDPKCRKCPYKAACLAEASGNPLPEEQTVQASEPEEPEELFRQRLQDKIKAQWGEK